MAKLELKMVYIERSKEQETIIPYWYDIIDKLKLDSKIFIELDGKDIYLGTFNKKTFVVICLKLLCFLKRKFPTKNNRLSQWIKAVNKWIVSGYLTKKEVKSFSAHFKKVEKDFFNCKVFFSNNSEIELYLMALSLNEVLMNILGIKEIDFEDLRHNIMSSYGEIIHSSKLDHDKESIRLGKEIISSFKSGKFLFLM